MNTFLIGDEFVRTLQDKHRVLRLRTLFLAIRKAMCVAADSHQHDFVSWLVERGAVERWIIPPAPEDWIPILAKAINLNERA